MIDSLVDTLIVFNLKFLLDSFCDSPATVLLSEPKKNGTTKNFTVQKS